jgi:DNA-binding transcriptional MerR regulator
MAMGREPSLTIGDVAAFAGVTVRAVRHYHQRGLLPEPPRDASGYRRYDAQAVVDLIRIGALSQAGVPLARVRELLAAEPDEFARALKEIDKDLQQQIHRLEAHRVAVAQLASVDSLALPVEVLDFLARLRSCGVSERAIGMERDQWLLLAAHAPNDVPTWVEQKNLLLDDERVVRAYLAFDQAYDWAPGDQRIDQLADELADLFGNPRPDAARDAYPAEIDDTVAAMLDAHTTTASPGWRHLAALLAARGFPTAQD